MNRLLLRRAVVAVVDQIAAMPTAFPLRQEPFRRAIADPFPYLVYFRFRDDRVIVALVVHARRDPRLTSRRLRLDLEE